MKSRKRESKRGDQGMTQIKCPLCNGEGCEYCGDGYIDPKETVWGHLQDAEMKMHHFKTGTYVAHYGTFLERLGRRLLRDTLTHEFYDKLYPDLEIKSSQSITSANWPEAYYKWAKIKPDYTLVLHCRTGNIYEKHAVVFEIKAGTSPIQKHHVDQWTDLIENPDKYIKKCLSIRVYVMWIYGLDPRTRNIFYSLKEFSPKEIPNNFEEKEESEVDG